MDDDLDLRANAGVLVTEGAESLDFERLKSLLDKLNPHFKCEICLQDRFRLQSGDVSAPCLPFYDLKDPFSAVAVRYCVELTCLTCGNTKLLDRKLLQARLAHEG